MTDYDAIEKSLRRVADESGYWTACTEAADAIRELRVLWERDSTSLGETIRRLGQLRVINDDLRAQITILQVELDEASPKRECDRCGGTFRMHQLVYEEGDELECFECNERENKRER